MHYVDAKVGAFLMWAFVLSRQQGDAEKPEQ
jgi:hypothetical protein